MWLLLPIAVAVFCISALVYYHVWEGGSTQARSWLQAVVIAIYESIGFMPAILLCALALVWTSIWFLGGTLVEPRVRVAKVLGCAVALSIWINLRGAGEPAGTHTGAFGNAIATRLVDLIGFVPSALLLAPLTLALFLLATDFLFYRHFDELWVPRERKSAAATGIADDGGVGHAEAEIFKSLAQAEEADRAAHEAAVAEAAIREARSSWRERRRRWRDTEVPAAAMEASPPDSVDSVVEPPAEAEPGEPEEPEVAAPAEVPLAATGEFTSDSPEELEGLATESFAEGSKAEPDPGEVLDVPVAPSDDGVGAFALAEGVIAEEIQPAPTAAPTAEDGEAVREDDTTIVEETVSEADVACELVVGDADESGTPVEVHVVIDEVAAEAGAAEDVAEEADQPEPEAERLEGAGVDEELAPTESETHESPAAAAVEEPVVEIPRPSDDALRQGSLFGLKRGDDPLVAEAIDLIQQSGRASASFLQRKLRVDFGTASQLLLILAERGVIELDADQSQGRLLR